MGKGDNRKSNKETKKPKKDKIKVATVTTTGKPAAVPAGRQKT